MSDKVELTRDGHVAIIMLNRPDVYNAVDLEMAEQSLKHVLSLSADNRVRGVVVSGKGRAFCAGGDLKWVLGYPQGFAAGFHELVARFNQLVLEIRRMRKPVIAAINGAAAGAGFTVSLASDFRVMARSAFFQQAYTSAGLCIDGGGSFTLPRIVGMAKALEILAFDRPIYAEQALNWGLVTEVVEDGQTLDRAVEMAHDLAKRSMHSFGWSKQLVTDSYNASFETTIERERSGIRNCAAHPDGQEGIRAFSEKRPPVFVTD
jgi:2-(1,2-epoxy-1,2-dihydrophenyl)acetyl-CoA isomerase